VAGPLIGIFDHDDPDLGKLFRDLRDVVPTKRIIFGLDETKTDVVFDPPDFALTQGSVTVTRADFETAPLVVFRRWRFLPEPMVRSSRDNPAERHFAEREWEALVMSALLEFQEVYGRAKWVNAPTTLTVARNKLWLMRMAAMCGLDVPRYVVSNHLRAPRTTAPTGIICKAINEYEVIDETRTFRTTTVEPSFLELHRDERAGCPSLLQVKVAADHEIRVIAWCDEFMAVKLETTLDYSDIRFLPKDEVERSRTRLPPEIEERLRVFMRRVGLRYSAFDFVVSGRTLFLIDVTPSGLWSPFDTDLSMTDEIVAHIALHIEPH
jgi:hypothetical protein